MGFQLTSTKRLKNRKPVQPCVYVFPTADRPERLAVSPVEVLPLPVRQTKQAAPQRDLEFTSRKYLQFSEKKKQEAQDKEKKKKTAQEAVKRAQKVAATQRRTQTRTKMRGYGKPVLGRQGRGQAAAAAAASTSTQPTPPTPAPFRMDVYVKYIQGRPNTECSTCAHTPNEVVDLGEENVWVRCPSCQAYTCLGCYKYSPRCVCGRKMLVRK